MNYQFDIEQISQHIVKYGVDIRPAIVLEQDKAKLQDYCNWLIEQFPEIFETLLAGPRQLHVQRTFVLSDGKRADLPTFLLTGRGPLFTFPRRLYINQAHDIDVHDRDKIFRKALDELRVRFPERTVLRIGVVNEFVFDTGVMNSLEVIASNLKNDVWRERIKNLRILLEAPRDGKNINMELRPTYLRPSGRGEASVSDEEMRFGIMVSVDINNQQMKDDMTRGEISDILAFADDYVPEELIRFLNNEY